MLKQQCRKKATAKVLTALVGNYNNNKIIVVEKNFILYFHTSCATLTTDFNSVMPTSSNTKKNTQLNYTLGMYDSRTTRINTTTVATAVAAVPALSSSIAISEHEQQEKHPCEKTKTRKTVNTEVMLLPLTSMSSKQILKGWLGTLMDKDVKSLQTTATETAAAAVRAETYRTDKPQSSLLSLTATEATAKNTTTTCLPLLATAAREKSCRKECLSIKMPLRHLIFIIMTVVVFSMEFTICSSTLLQQKLATIAIPNNTHLPTTIANKSIEHNDNLENLPATLATTTITSTTAKTSLLFMSSVSPSSQTSTTTSPASLPATIYNSRIQHSLESAALVEKKSPLTPSLTTVKLDDSSSNQASLFTGLATLTRTESPVIGQSSLQWENDYQDGSSELSLSTSILNTYDVSDLPPLSEAEQAAKDLLTKGFSIPTYLPPFPVFAVADLPAYLNTVSTTTTEAPINRHRPPDGHGLSAKENIFYFDDLDEHQLHGHHHNQLKMTPNRNSSMALANVTVQVGSHAYLPCHIHRLQNKPVSWVRLRDGHIISVDQTTFIADQRFQAIFHDDKEFTWSLQIKYVQKTDEGWYECQASSEPKMSANVFLKVIVPLTELIGDQSRFVKAGSKVALHCIVRGTLDPPEYIIWYREKVQIEENNKIGWYTQLDRNIFGIKKDNQNTIGSLIIPFVRKMDSGNYTCQPSNSASVSVDLHVLSGEYSASAIMSAARTYKLNDYYLLLILLLLMLLHKT